MDLIYRLPSNFGKSDKALRFDWEEPREGVIKWKMKNEQF
jgi:hypothetical protein